MSNKLDIPDAGKKLVSNMTRILDALIVDNVDKKRRLVTNAASTVQKTLDDANISANLVGDDKGRTEGQTRGHAKKKARDAYTAFKEQTQDIINYLEEIGFRDMEKKLYGDDEIQDGVKPVNNKSN